MGAGVAFATGVVNSINRGIAEQKEHGYQQALMNANFEQYKKKSAVDEAVTKRAEQRVTDKEEKEIKERYSFYLQRYGNQKIATQLARNFKSTSEGLKEGDDLVEQPDGSIVSRKHLQIESDLERFEQKARREGFINDPVYQDTRKTIENGVTSLLALENNFVFNKRPDGTIQRIPMKQFVAESSERAAKARAADNDGKFSAAAAANEVHKHVAATIGTLQANLKAGKRIFERTPGPPDAFGRPTTILRGKNPAVKEFEAEFIELAVRLLREQQVFTGPKAILTAIQILGGSSSDINASFQRWSIKNSFVNVSQKPFALFTQATTDEWVQSLPEQSQSTAMDLKSFAQTLQLAGSSGNSTILAEFLNKAKAVFQDEEDPNALIQKYGALLQQQAKEVAGNNDTVINALNAYFSLVIRKVKIMQQQQNQQENTAPEDQDVVQRVINGTLINTGFRVY